MKRSVLFSALIICVGLVALLFGCTGVSSTPTSIPVVSMASYPSAVLGVVIDQAGKVLYIEPGSAAERAGIARDDVLQKVANLSVDSQREQVHAAIQAAEGKQIVIELLKPNGNVTVMNAKLSASAPRTGSATATPLPANEDYL
jgi:S1-C subfamily serine protease